MKKSITALLLFAAMMLMTLTGCGETQSTLEDMASSDSAIQKTITDEIETPAGTTAKVEFSGDSFDVTYTFDDALEEDDAEVLVKAFDSNADALKDNCESAISDLSKQTSVSGITGTIHIVNADGSELWSCTYPETGTGE